MPTAVFAPTRCIVGKGGWRKCGGSGGGCNPCLLFIVFITDYYCCSAGFLSVPWSDVNSPMREEPSLDGESSRMEESSVRTSLEKLCQELNMDEQTATEAMQNFTAIWNTHTLEVNQV